MTDLTTTRSSARRLMLAAMLPVLGLVNIAITVVEDPHGEDLWVLFPILLVVIAPGVVGLLVVRRWPHHVVGWLLLLHAFLVGVGLATPPAHSDSHAALVAGQLTQGSWVVLYAALVLIGYLFPDGRFLSPRWRRWGWFCLAGYVAFVVGAAADRSGFTEVYPGKEPPIHLPAFLTAIGFAGLVIVAASLVGTVVCARQRLKRATGDERLQMLWFTWAAASIPTMLGLCWLDFAITGTAGLITLLGITVLGSVIPIVIGIAILRFRLFDIELVLSRTLTYGALTLGVVGTYAMVLWGAGSLFDNRSLAGLLAVGLVAVVVQPAHALLRRRVEHWVYGDRSDPTLALRRLSDRVEQTTDPALVVQTVTESVAEALRVDRVWVELVRDDASPIPGDQVVRVPLSHRGERLGDLAVEVPPGRQLAAPDLALLNDLARHASVVVNAVHLTLDLQRSRARLVTTREEERRRLRRDLHDGLGPSLAAIVLKLNAAQSRLDADERNRLLTEAREETRAAITEVRRLVDDLRPPAIDEVGLIGAIRQRAASLANPELLIEVSGPARLPVLPAAVEVAAFRIATEAITNVSRHSGATHCVVHLAVNGAFELSVTDNGRGARLGTNSGVGWISMAERAAELGGSCTISTRTEGGTVVRAVLPLPSTTPESVDA
jgi:two-component system, NarL family, sensor kinase